MIRANAIITEFPLSKANRNGIEKKHPIINISFSAPLPCLKEYNTQNKKEYTKIMYVL